MSDNDSLRATALLEDQNPVALDGLVSGDELDAARIRIQQLIADAAPSPAAGGTAEQRRRGTTWRRSGRGRSLARLTAAGLAIGTGAAAIAITTSTGPATQSASARTISRALRALQPPPGSILHFDFTGTSHMTGGSTSTWRQDVWNELDSPWQQLVIDQHLHGTPAGTAQTYNELYDPRTNTLFELHEPDSPPQVHITAAQRRTMTPSQLKALEHTTRQLNQSGRHPWMSGYINELKSKLASGRAHVDGPATIDGQRTIKITFRGSRYVDFVNPRTYVPVEVNTSDFGDGTTTYLFHTFTYLRAATHAAVFNLAAAHPTAKIDTSLHDYQAAYRRLFR